MKPPVAPGGKPADPHTNMPANAAGWAGSRRLLRQLRDIMAGPDSAQARLDRIATLIARELVAEVCSIYVRRAGDVLELFATEGLRPDAVRNPAASSSSTRASSMKSISRWT